MIASHNYKCNQTQEKQTWQTIGYTYIQQP